MRWVDQDLAREIIMDTKSFLHYSSICQLGTTGIKPLVVVTCSIRSFSIHPLHIFLLLFLIQKIHSFFISPQSLLEGWKVYEYFIQTLLFACDDQLFKTNSYLHCLNKLCEDSFNQMN
jgi:hypothetical protein